jgi:hypothetical protein
VTAVSTQRLKLLTTKSFFRATWDALEINIQQLVYARRRLYSQTCVEETHKADKPDYPKEKLPQILRFLQGDLCL